MLHTPQPKKDALVVVLTLLGLAGMALGLDTTPMPTQAQVPCATPWNCGGDPPDTTVDSSVNVSHIHTSEYAVKDATETFTITARYRRVDGEEPCDPCEVKEYTATATVTKDAFGSYHVSTSSYAPPFRGIDVCAESNTCSNPNYYKLHVSLDTQVTVECPGDDYISAYLEQVLYKTSAVANAVPCGPLDLHAWPLSQTWQTADNGQFECNDSCPSGASLQIQYW